MILDMARFGKHFSSSFLHGKECAEIRFHLSAEKCKQTFGAARICPGKMVFLVDVA